jgi:predicted ATPase
VPRLDRPAAGALVAAIAGRHQLAARLGSEILARSDGIPLFIEEMTKAVIETAPAGEAVSVPATLRDSLIARLDVSPAMKAAAQIASCIGRDFDEALLLSIADIAPVELQEGLAALLQAGLVVAQAGGRFRFKHALLCDIASETLLTPRREKLHQRIAEALEAMPGNFAEREPESLARHWFAAGQNARGEVYWLRARHRVAHWEEQLDALADYLNADTAEIIPIHGGPGVRKLH